MDAVVHGHVVPERAVVQNGVLADARVGADDGVGADARPLADAAVLPDQAGDFQGHAAPDRRAFLHPDARPDHTPGEEKADFPVQDILLSPAVLAKIAHVTPVMTDRVSVHAASFLEETRPQLASEVANF